MNTDTLTKHIFGKFTWIKRSDDEWTLEQPIPGVSLTHFSIKNYGGEPGPGFRGWKLVSGGPFDSAGAYHSFEEAVRGVTPFIMTFYRGRAKTAIDEAQHVLNVLTY